MLHDKVRVHALERADQETVTPGDIVIDLGCGTGLLSLFALWAGAKRVYAIESGDVAALGAKVFRANGVADAVQLIQARSDRVELPEKADVLLGYVAFDEGMLQAFVDARNRFLRPGARIIPRRL